MKILTKIPDYEGGGIKGPPNLSSSLTGQEEEKKTRDTREEGRAQKPPRVQRWSLRRRTRKNLVVAAARSQRKGVMEMAGTD